MKHPVSHFYNALLEYDPLHQAKSETNFIQYTQRKQIDSQKVCSKCLPLARTQACERVGHWSPCVINQCLLQLAMPHTRSTVAAHQCHESGLMHALLNKRPKYVKLAYLQSAFIPFSRYLIVIKIHQGFQEL